MSTDLQPILEAVERLVDNRSRAEALMAALDELKREAHALETGTIPSLMAEAHVNRVDLGDGSIVEVKPFITCRIDPDKKEEAYAWLDENEHGSLIKAHVHAQFGRDQLEDARAVATMARNRGAERVDVEQTVHWKTLESWAKDLLNETGEVPPEHVFKYEAGLRARITPPKKR